MKKYHILVLLIFFFMIGCADSSREQIFNNDTLKDSQLHEQQPQNERSQSNNEIVVDTIQESKYMSLNKIRVLSDILNIRSQPSIKSNILSKCYEGYLYEILSIKINDQNQLWYQIEYDHNKYGWIISDYCKEVNSFDPKFSYENYKLTINSNENQLSYHRPQISDESMPLKKNIYEIFETYIDSDKQIWYKVYSYDNNMMCWIIGDDMIEVFQDFQTEFKDNFIIQFEDPSLKNVLLNHLELSKQDITYGDIKNIESIYITPLDTTTIMNIAGLEFFDNLKSLVIGSNDVSTINCISRLKNIESLIMYENNITDYENISNFPNLKTLNLSDNNINNIRFVSNLTDLEFLQLSHNEISNITALSSLQKLKNINLSSNNIKKLDALTNLTQLEDIQLDDNMIEDISSLSNLITVKRLSLNNNNIKNIDSLKNLVNLYTLYLDYNNIESFVVMEDFKKISNFSMTYNNISSLEESLYDYHLNSLVGNPVFDKIQSTVPILNIDPQLESIIKGILYEHTNNTDLDAIAKKPITLGELNLIRSIDLRIKDDYFREYPELNLMGIEYCSNLKEIYFESYTLKNINSMATLKNLYTVGIYDSKILSIQEIKTLDKIRELSLGNIEAFDLNIVNFLPNLKSLFIGNTNLINQDNLITNSSISKIYIYGTQLTNLNFLKDINNLKTLHLEYCQLSDIKELALLTKLTDINLTNNEIIDISPLSNHNNLTSLMLKGNNITDYQSLKHIYPNLKASDFELNN